jgi:hypothetical protein
LRDVFGSHCASCALCVRFDNLTCWGAALLLTLPAAVLFDGISSTHLLDRLLAYPNKSTLHNTLLGFWEWLGQTPWLM